MSKERIGVEVILTNRYSKWDGIAAAIIDPTTEDGPDIRFYIALGAAEIVQRLLREGLEISKVGLLTYRYSEIPDLIKLRERLAGINPNIKVEWVSEKDDPFVDVEIPPNH